MELVRGIKITDFCDQSRLTTRQRLELLIQVCQAVQHAHQKGIIHRDLKPSNILVTLNDGVAVPKIIDFGIAKATGGRLTDLTVYTEFNQLIGTPAYMSPEQALMTSVDIDTRSDIYSLGVLLYELLTGKPPFENKVLLTLGLDEMRRTIREKEPLRPSTRLGTLSHGELDTTAKARGIEAPRLCSTVRGDLDWIAMKCLEKDRAQRYETANGLASDLKRHLNSEPVVARPPSRLYEFQKTVRQHKLGFAATAAVIGALAVGVIASTWQASLAKRAEHEQERLRRQAEAERYTSDMNLAKQALDEGSFLTVNQLLRAHIPAWGEPDLRGFEWRYLWSSSQINHSEMVLPTPEDPVRWLASSPSHSFVVAQHDKTIRLLEPATGRELDRFAFPAPPETNNTDLWPMIISLAPGATNLLASKLSGGVVTLWDLASKAELMRLTNRYHAFALSADGRYLAAASLGEIKCRLDMWDISTRPQLPERPLWSTNLSVGLASLAFTPDGRTLIGGPWLQSTILVWDVSTGRSEAPFLLEQPHSDYQGGDGITVSVSPDGVSVAASVWGAGIQIFNFTNRTLRCSFDVEKVCLGFSPDSRRLVASCADRTIHLWDLLSQKPIGLWRGSNDRAATTLAWDPAGKCIVLGAFKETRIWGIEPARPEPMIEVHHHGQPLISPDGKLLVTLESLAYADPKYYAEHPVATVWDIGSRRPMLSLDFKPASPSVLAFSSNGAWFALANRGNNLARNRKEGVVGIWRSADWAPLSSRVEPLIYLPNTDLGVGSLCFSPDGRILAATADWRFVVSGRTNQALASQSLTFWEVGTWKKTNILHAVKPPGSVLRSSATSMDFSKDGQLLAIGDIDGWVRLWSFKDRCFFKEFRAHKYSPSDHFVRFSDDSRWLISSRVRKGESSVLLFDLGDFEHPRTLQTASDAPAAIESIQFTPDNKSLVTIAKGLLEFWNLQTLRVTLTLGPSQFLAFAPDGTLLATENHRTVRLWAAPSLEEIDRKLEKP
jgi:WD40 repeat protein